MSVLPTGSLVYVSNLPTVSLVYVSNLPTGSLVYVSNLPTGSLVYESTYWFTCISIFPFPIYDSGWVEYCE